MVELHIEDVDTTPSLNSEFLRSWFEQVCSVESKELGDVNVVLCSDEYLLEMNRTHLDHDYYTDIITFDYCEGDVISGDLFVSTDRVLDNANEMALEYPEELHRVCVHGFLHLCGYKDKSSEEEVMMRSKENEMLNLRSFHVKHLKG